MKAYKNAYAETLKKYTEIVQSIISDSETEGSQTDIELFDKESDFTMAEIGVEAGDADPGTGNGEREQNVIARTLNTSIAAKIAAHADEIEANMREMETIEERLAEETLKDKLKGQDAKIEILKSFLGTFALQADEGDMEVESKQDLKTTTVPSTAGAVAAEGNSQTIFGGLEGTKGSTAAEK